MSSQEFCPYHPRSIAEFHCSECNTAMCALCNVAKVGESPLCRQCETFLEENASKKQESSLEYRQEKLREAENEYIQKIEKHGKQKSLMQMVVIVLAVFIAPFQFYRSDSNTQNYSINLLDEFEIADECIQILFDVADLLEQDASLDEALSCPGSNETLRINRTQDNVEVTVLNPERYGFSKMSVSLNQPIPELIDL